MDLCYSLVSVQPERTFSLTGVTNQAAHGIFASNDYNNYKIELHQDKPLSKTTEKGPHFRRQLGFQAIAHISTVQNCDINYPFLFGCVELGQPIGGGGSPLMKRTLV